MKLTFYVFRNELDDIKFLLKNGFFQIKETIDFLTNLIYICEQFFKSSSLNFKLFRDYEVSENIFNDIKKSLLKIRREKDIPFMFSPNSFEETLFSFHIEEENFEDLEKKFCLSISLVDKLSNEYGFKNIMKFNDFIFLTGLKALEVFLFQKYSNYVSKDESIDTS